MTYAMIRGALVPALLSALLACDAEDRRTDPDQPTASVVCAPTPGGAGGDAGAVFIATPDAAALGASLARLDVAEYEDFVFDATDIDPARRIDIVTEGASVLAFGEWSDPPLIEVDELRIRAGASLALSCDTRIRATRLVIEAGAALVFSSRNHNACVFSMPAPAPEAGMPGAKAFIEAGVVQLDGVIDLSGADGDAGQPGGSGGGLTLVAETLALGPDAGVLANGGRGGDGQPETEC